MGRSAVEHMVVIMIKNKDYCFLFRDIEQDTVRRFDGYLVDDLKKLGVFDK